MTTIQDQYTELLKQGQDTALSTLKTFNRTFERAFGQLPAAGLTTLGKVVDDVYDFAGQVLDAQRYFARQIITDSAGTAEKVRSAAAQRAKAA